jgi:NAD(P)H-dependent FMN reductase
MMTISVIVGSTRQGRFSEKPAQWILQHLQKRKGIEGRVGEASERHDRRSALVDRSFKSGARALMDGV